MVVKVAKSQRGSHKLTVEQLLNAVSTFLNSRGGLENQDDCGRFNNCMKQLAGSVENMCTFLNVLNATEDEAVLSKLLSSGAWETLHSWLTEFKDLGESPVLVLLLQTFHKLPLTMELLKSNSTAKIIKGLRKHSDDEVKGIAGDTVEKWMQLIKSKTGGTSHSSSQPPTKNGEHKDKEKKKKRHKHESDEKTEDKAVAGSPPKEDMDVDRDVPSPPPHALFKDSSKSSSSEKGDTSTAKVHTVKERSAGVEAGLIKPKPRGSKPAKAAVIPTKPVTSSGFSSSHKRVSIEIPSLPEQGSTAGSKKPKFDTDKEEDFGKAKLIAPLPKPSHIVQDSGGFMEALMQPKQTRPAGVIKRKRVTPKTPTSPTEKVSPPNTPVSPVSAPPSFYKDTLEGPSGASPPHPPSLDSSDRLSPVESTVSSVSNTDDSKVEPQPESSGSKPVKKVSWKPERELREYHYFELLEDERVNVNRLRDQGGFDEMKKREMLTDRAALKGMQTDERAGMKHSHALPTVIENFPWKRPVMIDLPESKVVCGSLSSEKMVQTDREVKVLAAIYFSKATIPSTAAEPDSSSDTEASSMDSTLTIPLEISGGSTLVDNSQPILTQPLASAPPSRGALLAAPTEQVPAVNDLMSGVSANNMDIIQKLANGEGGQEILEALASTPSDYLHQIMQTEGMSPLENNSTTGQPVAPNPGAPLLGDHPHGLPPNFHQGPRPMMGHGDHRGGFNGNFYRGRGGYRPQFNRGGFRGGGPGGSWNNRGRGGKRGRGSDCHHFLKLGRCDFGDKCMYKHVSR
ncbi:serine/threonine-protein phosphatase 1 regulatory subunit 10-like [Watersipora subatra]|uniref:serine/threonine-protein phosphatase 1 regulatory subunit 10-like n=1 Tax=Watersipora subatra TaxID=2589382 RepID=UPI00355B1B7A